MTRAFVRAGAVVVRHPSLWPTAVRQWVRLTPPRWWRQAPHLPVPSGEYLAFRLATQYGDEPRINDDDVLNYLRWCRELEQRPVR
ncbi:MAG: hypothetical protein HRT86_11645 [Ilumatobacteraceae bacterium]|nr:hypothetical protein [Ilumatobacteraceae bacterium]